MLIKQIEYDGGLDYKGKIVFDKKSIISSEHNEIGKSTLLRVILYALGFEVVMTNGIADLNLKTKIKIVTDNLKEIQIYRNNDKVILEQNSGEEEIQLQLPDDRTILQSSFLNFSNNELLKNCLGTFYFEQDRYSLINYGVVTPKNHFDLRELIIQLVPEVEEKLKEIDRKENVVKRRISAINAINAVLRDQNDQDNLLEENDQDEVTIQNVNALKFKLKQLKRKKHAVMESIDNQIDKTKQLIRKNEQAVKEKYENKDAHFTIPKAFNLDKNNAMLKYLQGQKEDLILQKKSLLIEHSYQELQDKLYKLYTDYANELKLSNWLKNGIFSSKNISGLIGTEREFTSISIRLAAVKLIEESTKINLPIILDSPFQELDSTNKKLLIDFLEKEFSEKHQIIITSVADKIPTNIDNWQIITLEG